jgi:aminoglycoside N3'-acetyltransferase
VAAIACRLEIFKAKLISAKKNPRAKGVNKFLLGTNYEGRTIVHVAAEVSELNVFQGILNLAKENLTTEEVIKLSLAKVNGEATFLRVAEAFYELVNRGDIELS